MAPSKALAWPREIYNDDEVQSLDDQGRFIICRVCAERYAALGGKRPKPVAMNAGFRTRAWETHKRRTRAHRAPQGSNAASQHSDGSFAMTAFLQKVAADRHHQKHGFNAQYSPLPMSDAVVFTRTTARRNPLPTPEPYSFVNHLALEQPGDPDPQVFHQNIDLPVGHVIKNTAWAPLSHLLSAHPQECASRALPLSQLLNPVDSTEDDTLRKHNKAGMHPVADSEQWAGKKQRSAYKAIPDQPLCCSSKHVLYLKTVREVLSCDLSTANAKRSILRHPQHHREDQSKNAPKGS